MTFAVTLLWTVVFIPTVIGFFHGTLFAAPCLNSLPPSYVEKLPMGGKGAAGEEGHGAAAEVDEGNREGEEGVELDERRHQ